MPAITRSGKLANLTLKAIRVSPADLEELLKATPSLAILKIMAGDMISPAILRKVACGELVPKLAELQCLIQSVLPDLDLHLDLHLEMLEKRNCEETPAVQITDITFRMTDRRPSSIFHSEPWKRLIEKGCKITVYSR